MVLRVALTAAAARMLTISYLQLAGGILVICGSRSRCSAMPATPPDAAPAPKRFWQAIWYIVLADLTMSTDNILAIAGASKGNLYLILFGLALSIPFIVLSSNLLAKIMDRYPVTMFLGAGILGKVGGEMILTDPAAVALLHPSYPVRFGVEALLVVGLMATGWVLSRA